jgi:hypothetical protein
VIRKARCCCGKCEIEVKGEPDFNALCHCTNCKMRTGSAFGWSAYFGDGSVLRTAGPFKIYEISGSNPQKRQFCSECGTTLFWKAALAPDHTGIAGGCFVETPLGEPDLTVSNSGRCAWLTLPESWRTSLRSQ